MLSLNIKIPIITRIAPCLRDIPSTFFNLFESLPATEAANPIELPLLTSNIFKKAEVATDKMTTFFQFFYLADQTTLVGSDGCVLSTIDYLAFYFQCERLESQIQQWTITWMQANQSTLFLNFFLSLSLIHI